jgi:hypothetical protein
MSLDLEPEFSRFMPIALKWVTIGAVLSILLFTIA